MPDLDRTHDLNQPETEQNYLTPNFRNGQLYQIEKLSSRKDFIIKTIVNMGKFLTIWSSYY